MTSSNQRPYVIRKKDPIVKLDNTIPRFRLDLFLGDFRHSLTFARFILEKKLHKKKRTDHVRLVHLAFNTSLIVSYSRPFFGNQNRSGKAKSSLKYLDCGVDEDEAKLHALILEQRNQVYAHSQASAHLFTGLDYDSKVAHFYRSVEPLSESQTRRLAMMIKKWITYLIEKRSNYSQTG